MDVSGSTKTIRNRKTKPKPYGVSVNYVSTCKLLFLRPFPVRNVIWTWIRFSTVSVLQDFIPEAIPNQKCHMNMGPILDGVSTTRFYSWGHSHLEMSYEYGSDYRRLWGYGYLKYSLRVQAWISWMTRQRTTSAAASKQCTPTCCYVTGLWTCCLRLVYLTRRSVRDLKICELTSSNNVPADYDYFSYILYHQVR
jgi:hypothetical protein